MAPRRAAARAVVVLVAAAAVTPAAASQAAGALAGQVQAQGPATETTLRLSVEEAVKMGLEHNVDLAVDRVDPETAVERVAQAAAAFKPALSGSLLRNYQVQPPTSFLVGQQGVEVNTFSSTVGVSQRLSFGGSSYSVSVDGGRVSSTSQFSNYNPSLTGRLQLAFSQPLLRDLTIDGARQQLVVTKRNKTISDSRFRESVVRTIADVKKAYWDLAAARAAIDVQSRSLELANELVRTNAARVEVGLSPELDLVSAKAEQAQREEALVVAEVAARQAEDRLRLMILAPESPTFWTARIETADTPVTGAPLPDLDQVVRQALGSRQDIIRARAELANAATNVKYYASQRLPDLRLQASLLSNGLAGTRIIRTGGFPGTITGKELSGFDSVFRQLRGYDYPTWNLGVTFSYPIGYSFERASLAGARLQEQQARLRLQSLEVKAVRQLRQAAWLIEANAKRIETSRAGRDLAEKRQDAEQKRYEVGMSTSFLVVQAQRDLAQARNNELVALLEYVRSVIEFEALQEAGPATGTTGSTMTVSGSSVTSFGAPVITGSTSTTGSTSGRTSSSTSGMPPGIF